MLWVQALMAFGLFEIGEPRPVEPWRHVHDWLSGRSAVFSEDLDGARSALLDRAREAEDAEALLALEGRPAEIRPKGYGVLPEIVADAPLKVAEPRANRYSLEELTTSYTEDLRDASLLARRAQSDEALPLGPWVDEYLRLRSRLDNFEDHLNYHARWQTELRRHRSWFERRNRIVDRVERWTGVDRESDPEGHERARREVYDTLAPFRPTSGLRIESDGEAGRRLRLVVWTDIEDDSYLDRVRRAVEGPFRDAAARESIDLRLEIAWKRVTPRSLYAPDSAPAGELLDREAHLKRFPESALVLTTGVESTVAVTGRAVVLGCCEIAPNVLAHEFAHLLGFDDAYLRGFEGDPGGIYGATFVEWVGLFDDLMGNPGGGAVSRAMLRQLERSYGAAD